VILPEQKIHVYEVRPRSDKRGFDLIAARSRSARLWYLDTGDAVDYAKHRSR